MKRQPTEWEKIYPNESTDKGLNLQNMQKIHNNNNNNNKNNPIKKMGKRPE